MSRVPRKGIELGVQQMLAVGCAYVSNPWRWFEKQLYDYKDVYEPVQMQFEKVTFLSPSNYEIVTRKMNGDNYKELPDRYGVHKENPNRLFTEVY